MEFWPEILTKASWEKLVALKKEFNFILIGGWAAYLHTGLHKSKDIAIVVNYDTLKELGKKYDLVKNSRLKKYEIKFTKFDIDIYVPYFSKLVLPLEELDRHSVMIKGIRTPKPESLLMMKQDAEIDRRNSIKGEKDAIDILTLILRTDINWQEYLKLVKRHKKESFLKELIFIINNFPDKNIKYLGISFIEFKKWKKKIVALLKRLEK